MSKNSHNNKGSKDELSRARKYVIAIAASALALSVTSCTSDKNIQQPTPNEQTTSPSPEQSPDKGGTPGEGKLTPQPEQNSVEVLNKKCQDRVNALKQEFVYNISADLTSNIYDMKENLLGQLYAMYNSSTGNEITLEDDSIISLPKYNVGPIEFSNYFSESGVQCNVYTVAITLGSNPDEYRHDIAVTLYGEPTIILSITADGPKMPNGSMLTGKAYEGFMAVAGDISVHAPQPANDLLAPPQDTLSA